MSVDCQVTVATKIPAVLLVDLHADQVRHYAAQSLIMIAFDPHDLHAALGIGKLADVAQEFPVWLCQAAKIEVREDIAQQD